MENKQSIYIGLGFLILGLALGWFFFGGSDTDQRETVEATEHTHDAGEVWTCSMHPQIREDGPGQCPICGMDLIPVAGNPVAGNPVAGNPVTDARADIALEGAVQMTQAAMQIANVQTVTVERAEPTTGMPTKEIYLSGKVEADERNIAEIAARFGGRIEKLFVNFTGQEVKRGQALASVYSPELVTAQKELFEAAKFRESNPSFYEAAVNKLKLWDLSDRQIQSILKSREVRYSFNLLAPQSGTVVARNVSTGDYVEEGRSLFEVANLDRLWVVFDAYQSDLPWIEEGDTISFTVQSLPGQTFTSEVTFINPTINPQRRVAEVRTEVKNNPVTSRRVRGGSSVTSVNKLKLQMFAQGVLKSTLPGVENALVIPKSAVLWTGKRAVVYVKQPEFEQPTFAYREVVLGPEAGGYYVVNEGLEAGEEIVVNGVFKVDAAAQLQGKVSMMSPETRSPPVDTAPTDTAEGGTVSARTNPGEMATENATSAVKSDDPIISQNVPPEFRQQLAAVVAPYLVLKNALVAADAEAAATAAEQTRQVLADVNLNLVKSEAHWQWMEYLAVMQEKVEAIAKDATLETQRKAFVPLSQTLYQSLRQFAVTGLDLYYQYCPMADSDQGAYWLSELPEINNPYFGNNMLTCGSVKETLN